ARLGSSSAMIIWQTSPLVRRKKLGADGRHWCPSASISSAMANAAAWSFGWQVMAKRRRSRSHSRIRPARQSCEPNCCIDLMPPGRSPLVRTPAPQPPSLVHARTGLDPKAVAFEHGAKRSTGGRLQRVEPDDQHARETQEVCHPIERRLDRFDRTLPSIEEHHVILPGREAAVRRSRCASVTQTMQIDHGLGAVVPVTMILASLEQCASAIIGSTMRSPAAVIRIGLMTDTIAID